MDYEKQINLLYERFKTKLESLDTDDLLAILASVFLIGLYGIGLYITISKWNIENVSGWYSFVMLITTVVSLGLFGILIWVSIAYLLSYFDLI